MDSVMVIITVPITPITTASIVKTVKTLQGSAEAFTSSYDPSTDIVTITESDGTIHAAGYVTRNNTFLFTFTSKNGKAYNIKPSDVT